MWDGRWDGLHISKHCMDLITPMYVALTLPHSALDRKHANLKRHQSTKGATRISKMRQTQSCQPLTQLFQKKENSIQWCMDYIKPNMLTVESDYPIPGMDDCLNQLCEAHILYTENTSSWNCNTTSMIGKKTKQPLHHKEGKDLESCGTVCRGPPTQFNTRRKLYCKQSSGSL